MVPAKDGGFGVLTNGNWSGLRGQLQRKVISVLMYIPYYLKVLFFYFYFVFKGKLQEVDIACTALAGTVGFDVIDLAVHVFSDSYGILVQYPVPQTSDYSHIITFSLNVNDINILYFRNVNLND